MTSELPPEVVARNQLPGTWYNMQALRAKLLGEPCEARCYVYVVSSGVKSHVKAL